MDYNEIFYSWEKENWINWIEDILINNYAYPISKLQNDGDEIRDMMKLLMVNNIDTLKYEMAITKLLSDYSYYTIFNDRVSKLVDGLIHIKSNETHRVLLALLNDVDFSNQISNGSKIATKIIQIYTFKLEINNEIKDEIKKLGYYYVGINDNYEIGFTNNYLSFLRSQFSSSIMFDFLYHIFENFENVINYDTANKLNIIVKDKLNEIYYFDKGNYINEYYNFLLSIFKNLDNPMYDGVIDHIIKVINIDSPNLYTESSCNKLRSLLNILNNKKLDIHLSPMDWEGLYTDVPYNKVYDLFSKNIELINELVEKYRVDKESPILIESNKFNQTIINHFVDIINRYNGEKALAEIALYKNSIPNLRQELKNDLNQSLKKVLN